MKRLLKTILTDIKVKLSEEFDRNFERKAFFNEKWNETRRPARHGSLLIRTGKLRRSINSRVQGNTISWSSSVPYAEIQNNGGQITVTAQMKKYFWAMYHKAIGGLQNKKDGSLRNNKANRQLSAEAEYYKSLALMKIGTKITIQKRPFIGSHPEADKFIREIFSSSINEYLNNLGTN